MEVGSQLQSVKGGPMNAKLLLSVVAAVLLAIPAWPTAAAPCSCRHQAEKVKSCCAPVAKSCGMPCCIERQELVALEVIPPPMTKVWLGAQSSICILTIDNVRVFDEIFPITSLAPLACTLQTLHVRLQT
jgi:hypothetical protein